MLMSIVALAGALAQAQTAAPTPPVGRTLKDVPNITITYFDVTGRTGPAIETSLKKMLGDPAIKKTGLYTYNVSAQIKTSTTDKKCTVTNVNAMLKPAVRLPHLAEEARVPKPVLANWRTYVTSVESEVATNLWFIIDHLRDVEKTVVGLPCDQANTAWNAGIEKLKIQLAAFASEQAKAVKKSAATAKE